MASNNGVTGSSSSSSNAGDSYVGSLISLISKYEIRYEGILYHLNVQDSIVGLNNVRSYGTEGRKKDGPQIPPSDKVYEYILFRGSDIKDLQVKSAPPAKVEEHILNDPAIIQSHHAGVASSSSPSASDSSNSLMDSREWQGTPALSRRAYSGSLSSCQSVTQVGESNLPHNTKNAASSVSTPLYWQGYNGTSISISPAPQNPSHLPSPSSQSSPLGMQNQMQALDINTSPVVGLINTTESITPVPSSNAPNLSYFNFPPPLGPGQCSTSLDIAYSSSIKPSVPLHAAYMTASRPSMSLFPSSPQTTNATEVQVNSNNGSEPILVHPPLSNAYPVSSLVGSTHSLFPPPPSFILDQFALSTSNVLPLTQEMSPDQKDLVGLTSISSSSSPAISAPASQEPLLPLPISANQPQDTAIEYGEEFDFEAMNQKFKKDEVWGYIGKAKQRDKTQGVDANSTEQDLGDQEVRGRLPYCEPKPAYNKDEFFDTISCNSLNRRAWNGQNRFSERMRMDTEEITRDHSTGEGDMAMVGEGGVEMCSLMLVGCKLC
ncbi:decapping 5-like protein isoform X2 [Tripterygium wilfordii]|uniref:decapping 5-like protein isoform X2 n=1 Tax=Tripterygium wilfordii TaxID=458696 RepID=UPI0018F7E668|nr:decapping 5-like protein isoform X2 [Tripterygium wilfordii]